MSNWPPGQGPCAGLTGSGALRHSYTRSLTHSARQTQHHGHLTVPLLSQQLPVRPWRAFQPRWVQFKQKSGDSPHPASTPSCLRRSYGRPRCSLGPRTEVELGQAHVAPVLKPTWEAWTIFLKRSSESCWCSALRETSSSCGHSGRAGSHGAALRGPLTTSKWCECNPMQAYLMAPSAPASATVLPGSVQAAP